MARRRTRDCGELLDFREVEGRLQLGTRIDIGTREIPIRDVIGSVSRVDEFDGCFRPRTQRLRDLVRTIREAKPDAADDPILVYQVDHAYFVVDGHKRLAIAVEEGREFIDAEVSWYPSRFHLAAGTTIDAVRATEQERGFRRVTGLDVGVPDARFPLSDPDAYIDLAESVKAHAYDLSRERGEVVAPPEAARHWYEMVFAPVAEVVRREGFDRVLASCSDAEIFLLLRRGANGTMDPGWQMPDWFVEHARGNVRRSEPRGVPAAIARVTKRAKPRPEVLPTGDVKPPVAADGQPATLVRRPVRRAEDHSPG